MVRSSGESPPCTQSTRLVRVRVRVRVRARARARARARVRVRVKHAPVNDGRQRTPVEQLGTVLPRVGVSVLALALVVEAIDLRDLPRLVVAAQQRDPVRVPCLEKQQQRHRLHTIVPAVDKVALTARAATR